MPITGFDWSAGARRLRSGAFPAGMVPAGALLFALTVGGVLPEPAAGQSFRFRAAATRVLVDVLVLDADRVPVPGLDAGDFLLYEEGEEQSVLSVEVVDWGGPVVGPRIGPNGHGGVATPADLPARRADRDRGRTPRRFVLVFSRRVAQPALGRPGVDAVKLQRVKRGLIDFVENELVDGDETMVVDFGAGAKLVQDFSSVKEETLGSVRGLIPMTHGNLRGGDRDASDILRLLRSLGEALESVRGRKIIVLASEKLPTFADPRGRTAAGGRKLDSTAELGRTIRQLNQANATLYSVPTRGVYGHEDRILDAEPSPVGSDGVQDRLNALADADPGEGGAPSLAAGTGGRHFPNMTDFAVAFRAIGLENRLYYMLSFSPARAELDGGYRNLRVEVKGRPDLRIVARPGYFARERIFADDATTVVRGEFGYAAPRSLALNAYVLDRIPEGAVVAISAAAPASCLDRKAALDFRVVSEAGETVAADSAAVGPTRFWVARTVRLPPGTHAFSVDLLEDGEPVQAGVAAIEVPRELGERFAVSSVFPLVADGHRPPTDGPPVRPVAAFAPAETAKVVFLVHRGVADPAGRVRVAYTITNARGEVAVETEQPQFVPLDSRRAATGMPVMLPLSTAGLVAGRYTALIHVEDDRGRRSADGELHFEIR